MERFHLTGRWKVSQTRPFLHGFNVAINLLCGPWSISQYHCFIKHCFDKAMFTKCNKMREMNVVWDRDQNRKTCWNFTPLQSHLTHWQVHRKRQRGLIKLTVLVCAIAVCMRVCSCSISATNKQQYSHEQVEPPVLSEDGRFACAK